MPSPRSIASELPQESPKHTTFLILVRHAYLLELPDTLDVVTHKHARDLFMKL